MGLAELSCNFSSSNYPLSLPRALVFAVSPPPSPVSTFPVLPQPPVPPYSPFGWLKCTFDCDCASSCLLPGRGADRCVVVGLLHLFHVFPLRYAALLARGKQPTHPLYTLDLYIGVYLMPNLFFHPTDNLPIPVSDSRTPFSS